MSKGQQEKKEGSSYYGFDSTGLEKAATAAKYLDQSKNAKEAFSLAQDKEKTRQLELEDAKVQREIQRAQIVEEERRKTVQYETEMAKRRAEYQVQLELQRDQNKLQHKEKMQQEARQRDEESVQKQEQMRRDTLEYEYQLKASLKQQKLREDKKMQEEQSKKGKEFILEIFERAEKDKRETQRQNLMVGLNLIQSQFMQAVQNPKNVMRAFYLTFLFITALNVSKFTFAIFASRLFSKFGKPKLIRETSKIYTNNLAFIPFIWARKFYANNLKRHTQDQLLKGVILEQKLEDQLREISCAVLNRRKHYAPTKNMLFYGPPGTGKTLFAKKLAMQSGLEYAVMVGSDVAPLGPMAVTELNSLFDWAERQPNGMILFIDEADAFLRNRKSQEMSEYMRHTVNSFLYRTGTPSEKVVVVLATNSPEQLDSAVHDRIDEVVGFKLPTEFERRQMLFHYLVQYCQPPKTWQEKAQFVWKYPRSLIYGKKLIRVSDNFSKDVIIDIAQKTEGFSGREITKMVIAWHDAAFAQGINIDGSSDAVLTTEIMYKILDKFHLQHKLKDTWTAEEQLIMEKLLFSSEDDLLGSKKEPDSIKDENMVKQQEELMEQINKSRLDLKITRENEIEENQKIAQNMAQQNKQK